LDQNTLSINPLINIPRPNRGIWLYITAAIIVIAILARAIPGPRTIDDSFITYRYARNILAGNGFVYNPGERVLGTTTPLYTILLVILGLLTGGVNAPFPILSMGINALTDGLTCLLLLRLGRQLGSPLAGLGAALVWAIAPYSVTFAIGGLETSLYVMLLTGLVYSYIDERYGLAWLCGALSLLTRPDALILLGPLALDRFLQIGRASLRKTSGVHFWAVVGEALTFLVPCLSWIIFSALYFGSPLPHSISAKSLAYYLPGNAAFIRLLQHYATPFLEHLTFGIPWITVGIVLYLFLFLVGAQHALRVKIHLWPWIAYPWLYFATFAIANPLIFRWYLTPPLPAYIFFILIGGEQIIQQIFRVKISETQLGSIRKILATSLAFALVVLAPAGLSLQGWTLHPDHGPDRPSPEMAYIKLELLYRQAASLLSNELMTRSSTPLLAAGDVGVLGFYTGARILDTVGLNSPISTSYYPLDADLYTINYAIPPDLILDQSPDYIVILEVYGREGLLKDPRFHNAYHLRQKTPTDIYGSDGMLIFEKKSY